MIALDGIDVSFDDLGNGTVGADLRVGFGIVVEFVREGDGPWEAWAFSADKERYLERRDLTGEPLVDGPLRGALDVAFDRWRQANQEDAVDA